MNEDEAARHGERVDLVVLDHEEVEVTPAIGALRGEPLADGLDVLGDLRVFDERVLLAQLVRHHRAQAVLIAVRDHLLARAAQVRQVRAGGRGAQDDGRGALASPSAKATAETVRRAVPIRTSRERMVEFRPPRAATSFPTITDAYKRVGLSLKP